MANDWGKPSLTLHTRLRRAAQALVVLGFVAPLIAVALPDVVIEHKSDADCYLGYRAMAVAPDGSMFAGGYCSGTFGMRVDANGTRREHFQYVWPGYLAESQRHAQHLAALNDGRLAFAATERFLDVPICRVRAWDRASKPGYFSMLDDSMQYCTGIQAGADGALTLHGLSFASRLRIYKLRQDGSTIWARSYPTSSLGSYVSPIYQGGPVLAASGGRVVVAAQIKHPAAAYWGPHFLVYDSTGRLVVERYGEFRNGESFVSLAERVDGTFLVGLASPQANGSPTGIMRLAANGDELGRLIFAGNSDVVSLNPLVDGDEFTLVSSFQASSSTLRIVRFDASLNRRWRLDIPVSAGAWDIAQRPSSDGKLAVLYGVPGAQRLRLVVVDRNGNLMVHAPVPIADVDQIGDVQWHADALVIQGLILVNDLTHENAKRMIVARVRADASVAWIAEQGSVPTATQLYGLEAKLGDVFAMTNGADHWRDLRTRRFAPDGTLRYLVGADWVGEQLDAVHITEDGGVDRITSYGLDPEWTRARTRYRHYDATGVARWMHEFDGRSGSPALQVSGDTHFALLPRTHGASTTFTIQAIGVADSGALLFAQDVSSQIGGDVHRIGGAVPGGANFYTREGMVSSNTDRYRQGTLTPTGLVVDVGTLDVDTSSDARISKHEVRAGGWVVARNVLGQPLQLTRVLANGQQPWSITRADLAREIAYQAESETDLWFSTRSEAGTAQWLRVTISDGELAVFDVPAMDGYRGIVPLPDRGAVLFKVLANDFVSSITIDLARLRPWGAFNSIWTEQRSSAGEARVEGFTADANRAWLGIEAADDTGPVKVRIVPIDLDLFSDGFESTTVAQ